MTQQFRITCAAATLALGLAPAAGAQTVTYSFEWPGGGGYAMRGALSFDAALLGEQIVTEEDVDCFVVEGTHDGAPIGRWALGMLTETTTWSMTFDPVLEQFVVFGPGAPMPQAWNMNGIGTDCGPDGFGFNIGNAAQDLCLGGALLVESQVPPTRPFPAARDDGFSFPADACHGTMILSALPLAD